MPEVIEAAPETEGAQTELGKDGQPFDPTRAQATIDKLREEIKNLKPAATELATIKTQQAKAAEDEAWQKGEFERMATEYKGQAETTATERDALKAERDKAFELLNGEADKRLAALPEGARKHVSKDATPLERLAKIAELEDLAESFKPAAPGNQPIRGAQSNGNRAPEKPANDGQPKTIGLI